MNPLLLNLRRRLRWATGKGYSVEDFQPRYRDRAEDAWGYSDSELHRARHELILDALPSRRFATGMEAGCAEGHLTRHLARRVNRLVACDFSDLAIKRAKRRNADLENVEFVCADVREGLVVEQADLIVFSDVLYYMTPREIEQVIAECEKTIRDDGILLFANEWSDHYRHMTSPDDVLGLIDATGYWVRQSLVRKDTSAASSLTVAAYVPLRAKSSDWRKY